MTRKVYRYLPLLIIMAGLCVASCDKLEVRYRTRASIRPFASMAPQSGVTKSSSPAEYTQKLFRGDIDGVPVGIDLVVSENTEYFFDEPRTKGKIATTAGLNHTGESFWIHGYIDDDIASSTSENVDPADKTDFHFIGGTNAGEQVDYIGDNTNHAWDWHAAVLVSGTDEEKDAARPKWRANIDSRFWSYYPSTLGTSTFNVSWPHIASGNEVPTESQQKTVSFSYTLPAHTASNKDAEAQEDLIFAYNEQNYEKEGDEGLEIRFHHVLAAVNFDITTMEDEVEFDETITIKNVKYSGTCTISGPDLADFPDDAAITTGTPGVTWSNLGTDVNSYTQIFSKTDDFETLGTAPNQYIRQKQSGDKTFFMIPQLLTSNAALSIAFEFKDGGVPITLDMPLIPAGEDAYSWYAGRIYTYRISVGDGYYTLLDSPLDVKDWVDGHHDITF